MASTLAMGSAVQLKSPNYVTNDAHKNHIDATETSATSKEPKRRFLPPIEDKKSSKEHEVSHPSNYLCCVRDIVAGTESMIRVSFFHNTVAETCSSRKRLSASRVIGCVKEKGRHRRECKDEERNTYEVPTCVYVHIALQLGPSWTWLCA